MRIEKTSEKIIVWMHREKITGKQIADKIGITRQAWSNKLRDNIFTPNDLITVRRMGFKD